MLWPALIAINGFGFAANPASALELGELTLQSALGQPLRASIAYALAPNETIQSHCIFLRQGASAAGLPTVRSATASASNGVIRLAGSVPIREPILNLNLTVDCPGTANLSREYMLLVDPPTSVPAPVAATASRSPATVRADAPAASAPRRAPPSVSNGARIGEASTYRVQPGDTLSGIAARIDDREIGLWEAVDVIFAANPDAFIGNDRNRLRAGSVLVLPDMGAVSADIADIADTADTADTAGNTPARAYESPAAAASPTPAPATMAAAADTNAVSEPPVTAPVRETPNAASPDSAPAPAADSSATQQAADASTAADQPFVSTAEPGNGATSGTFGPARDVIPETPVDTAAARPTPRVSVATTEDGAGLSSLAWLGGTGIAIILGLLLFGRQLKDRFGSPGDFLPAGIRRGRRRSDVVAAPPATPLADDAPTDTFESPMRARPVTLDANLGTGSGLDDDGEIDVAQDFGFSTSRDLYDDHDGDLSGNAAHASTESPTDIVPTKRFDDRRFTDSMIVEEEIPPSDDTGEYDLSMIVDATRQPDAQVEDTTRDLRAVQVDTADHETLDSGTFTLSSEVDYKILEQDYEEELTATQALNAKILEEAELASQAEAPDPTANSEAPTAEYAAVDDELTMQLPGDDLEPTAQPEALDPTGNSEAPTAEYVAVDDELTMQLPGNDLEPTVEMPLDQEPDAEPPASLEDSGVNAEVTTELPAADNDETLDIESATIDTKKLRAS